MLEHSCFQCNARFTTLRDLEEHGRWYGHQAFIERRLRAKRRSEEPTQAEIDATLASIATAVRDG